LITAAEQIQGGGVVGWMCWAAKFILANIEVTLLSLSMAIELYLDLQVAK